MNMNTSTMMTPTDDALASIVPLFTARRAVEYYILKRKPVFVWGPPGVGKSDMVRQIRAARPKKEKWGLNDYRAILRDPVDLRGLPMVDLQLKKTVWVTPDDLPNEERDGKYGILFLDELNAADQDVQKAMYGLVLDRKLADYKLPDGWQIVAAGNRQQDRSSAQRMPKALANRFAHIEVAADAGTWITDYALENCHEALVGFMRWKSDMIHQMEVKDAQGKIISDERKFPTPRSWANVSDICDAPRDLLPTLVEGFVGKTAATEFVGYMDLFDELPDFDDILDRPDRASVPHLPSALWLIATRLARIAERDNFAECLTYANRMGREYQIVVAMEATQRDAGLVKTRGYVEFAQANSNVTIGSWNLRQA